MDAAPQPRWLTEEEMQSWLALAAMIVKLPCALDDQLQRDAGVTHFEYQVLAGLSEAPNRTMRMSGLSVFANGSLSRLSHVVSRLEKRGWVRRTPDPADGRFTLAILTDAGWDKIVASAPGHVDAVRRFVLDALSAEQSRQLRDIGYRIIKAIDPHDGCLQEPED